VVCYPVIPKLLIKNKQGTMIRCQKCGYQNQNNAQRCLKCNTPLVAGEEGPRPAGSAATQRDIDFPRQPWDPADTKEVVDKTSEPVAAPVNDKAKTVFAAPVASRAKGCTLIAISADRNPTGKVIPVKGEEINLNRELLDASNTSISRNGHAQLTYREGGWWLENLSRLKTTYVQVNHPVKLTDGDEIMLGDSLFKFREEAP
jgi:hypothetical protein